MKLLTPILILASCFSLNACITPEKNQQMLDDPKPLIHVKQEALSTPNKTTSIKSETRVNSIRPMPYQYMHARITSINNGIPIYHDSQNSWEKGAYLHLKEDGTLGHNWSEPGPYIYSPKQSWHRDGNILTLIFDQSSYSFNLTERTAPMVAYLDQGATLKMSAYIKAKSQK